MELQAVAVAVAELVEEDHAAVAQEAHKQLITQVLQAWTEQVQAEAETTTLVETVQKEVQA